MAVVGGHIVECFDVTLYGFLAVQLAPLFFPSNAQYLQTMGAFGAFAAGFIARPLGAFFFGYIGDKMGRKKPLLMSMVLVAIPTLIIGFLPSYDSIGIFSPVLLIACRLLQGFFYGGELTGASLYVMENLDEGTIGRNTGRIVSWGVIGAVIASGLAAIVNLEGMPSWGWRVLFFLGGISAFIVFLVRRHFLETIDFKKIQGQSNKKIEFPWVTLLRNHKKVLVLGVLVFGLTVMPLYLATVYGNSIFMNILGYTKSQAMVLNMAAMTLTAICIAFFGYIADKVGFLKIIAAGMLLTTVVSVPAFSLLNKVDVTLTDIIFFIGSISIAGSVINGCISAYIGSFFPVKCRYSGLAFCLTVGGAVLGGTTPNLAQFLKEYFGSILAPGFLLMGLSALTLFTLLWVSKTTKQQA